MPAMPSPPASGRLPPPPPRTTAAAKPSTVAKRPGSAASPRRPPSVASTRPGVSKAQQSTVASQQRAVTKARSGSDKENGAADSSSSSVRMGSSRGVRRQTSAGIVARDKMPSSKDRTAQRTAKEVDGLQDYVSAYPRTPAKPPPGAHRYKICIVYIYGYVHTHGGDGTMAKSEVVCGN